MFSLLVHEIIVVFFQLRHTILGPYCHRLGQCRRVKISITSLGLRIFLGSMIFLFGGIFLPGVTGMAILRFLFGMLAMLFAAMLSSAVSSCFRRTAPATVTSYLLLALLWGGSLMIWLGRDSVFGFEIVRSALSVNPLAAALSINRSPGFSIYNLVPINWWIMSGGSLICFTFLSIQTWRLSRPE